MLAVRASMTNLNSDEARVCGITRSNFRTAFTVRISLTLGDRDDNVTSGMHKGTVISVEKEIMRIKD